jgi:hypothetical protein
MRPYLDHYEELAELLRLEKSIPIEQAREVVALVKRFSSWKQIVDIQTYLDTTVLPWNTDSMWGTHAKRIRDLYSVKLTQAQFALSRHFGATDWADLKRRTSSPLRRYLDDKKRHRVKTSRILRAIRQSIEEEQLERDHVDYHDCISRLKYYSACRPIDKLAVRVMRNIEPGT